MPDQRDQFNHSDNSRDQQMNSRVDINNSDMSDNNSSDQRDARGNSGKRSSRGFAAMSPERQKQIASEGGRAAHRLGVAHEWNSDEARNAGRKGGQIVSQNREHMSEIGRRGGQNSGGRRNRNSQQSNNEDNNE
jgi:general stress protein YciG